MKRSVYEGRYKRLREHLVEARREAGLTQVLLAKKLRRTQSFVSNYERGERRLDVVEFMDVAEVLGVDPVALVRELHGETRRGRQGR